MKIKKICLDLDGVLNRLQEPLLHHFGYTNFKEKDYPIECGYDIVRVANKLSGYKRFTDKQFWDSVPRSLWATAPVSDEFDLILDAAQLLVGRSNICIVTGPTLDPECPAGKLEWIQTFLPSWLHRRYLIGPAKEFCANQHTLLVDDSDKNIDTFEADGGTGLLVPRPWNRGHGIHTKTWLIAWFNNFQRNGWINRSFPWPADGTQRYSTGVICDQCDQEVERQTAA